MKIEISSSEQLKIAFDIFKEDVRQHYFHWFEPLDLRVVSRELKLYHNGDYIFSDYQNILEFESELDYFQFLIKWS